MSYYLLTNTLWDMFLAGIPAVLGWLLGAGLRATRTRRWWLWAPLLLAWFLFLPNTCYLLTEFRHLRWRLDTDEFSGLGMSRYDEFARLFRWTAFYSVFAGFGLVMFVLAIRPLERLARERRLPVNVLTPIFFWLVALGVYLGLRLRFNTWDLLREPMDVLRYAWLAITGPEPTPLYITGFGVLLWLVYLMLDIWLDGLVLRLERWRRWGAGKSFEKQASSGGD